MIYTRISCCRICGSGELSTILNLGVQSLTGVFPPSSAPEVEAGPLELTMCGECHLVQLAHNYELSLLYGDTYGYRSGLNSSMVDHLRAKIDAIIHRVSLATDDTVLDIGSNDGTTLGAYPQRSLQFVGMDPTGEKFRKYYKPDIHLVPDFFSASAFTKAVGAKKAKIVTSIAMFYDLESPKDFAKQVASILDDEGIWVFEQSYLPSMINTLAYDTVCHEHLEYYCLFQIQNILKDAGLRILDVEFNTANGGSFSVTAVHMKSPLKSDETKIASILKNEEQGGYLKMDLYRTFEKNVKIHGKSLKEKLIEIRNEGGRIHGYGASTKGNVILQFCGIGKNDLEVIAEVNEEKYGRVTPGTNIPITSEEESRAKNPTHYLVLPWHFRAGIIKREAGFLETGGKLLFPLPRIEIVQR